ncbi:HU family DNA-binding protein [Porphyromonas crevioricanis]|nr:HU family DNA-binding protein [Porphyromonas crevioricanis]
MYFWGVSYPSEVLWIRNLEEKSVGRVSRFLTRGINRCLILQQVKRMNKSEFVAAVAEKSGLKKGDALKAVNAFIEVLIESLRKGLKISLLGFGTFSVVDKAERKGINPATKKPIIIKARKVAKFKPGAGLKL